MRKTVLRRASTGGICCTFDRDGNCHGRLRSKIATRRDFLHSHSGVDIGIDVQDQCCAPEIGHLGHTINKWRRQIAPWHSAQFTNRATEAVNNAIDGKAKRLGLSRTAYLRRALERDVEIGFSARSGDDHQALLAEPPIASMPVEYLTPLIEDRAVSIQSALAELGQHRAPSIPDLLIAATAELAELTVLHLDKDFELVASLTRKPHERLELR